MYSETRWYSKYNFFASLVPQWASHPALIHCLIRRDSTVVNLGKLLDIVEDVLVGNLLQIELSAYFEGLEPIVKFCYKFEGDGHLVFEAGQIIVNIYSIYPN